jgi:hypothetical protein
MIPLYFVTCVGRIEPAWCRTNCKRFPHEYELPLKTISLSKIWSSVAFLRRFGIPLLRHVGSQTPKGGLIVSVLHLYFTNPKRRPVSCNGSFGSL